MLGVGRGDLVRCGGRRYRRGACHGARGVTASPLRDLRRRTQPRVRASPAKPIRPRRLVSRFGRPAQRATPLRYPRGNRRKHGPRAGGARSTHTEINQCARSGTGARRRSLIPRRFLRQLHGLGGGGSERARARADRSAREGMVKPTSMTGRPRRRGPERPVPRCPGLKFSRRFPLTLEHVEHSSTFFQARPRTVKERPCSD